MKNATVTQTQNAKHAASGIARLRGEAEVLIAELQRIENEINFSVTNPETELVDVTTWASEAFLKATGRMSKYIAQDTTDIIRNIIKIGI